MYAVCVDACIIVRPLDYKLHTVFNTKYKEQTMNIWIHNALSNKAGRPIVFRRPLDLDAAEHLRPRQTLGADRNYRPPAKFLGIARECWPNAIPKKLWLLFRGCITWRSPTPKDRKRILSFLLPHSDWHGKKRWGWPFTRVNRSLVSSSQLY